MLEITSHGSYPFWMQQSSYNIENILSKHLYCADALLLLHSECHIWAVTWDFQQCGMCNQQRLRSACAYAQSDQSLCSSLEYSTSVKLLTEHHLEFLNLKWSACTYAQSDQSLCSSLEYSTSVKLLTEHHLEFLNLKWGCRDSSESTLVKMPHCWKSHVAAHITIIVLWLLLAVPWIGL